MLRRYVGYNIVLSGHWSQRCWPSVKKELENPVWAESQSVYCTECTYTEYINLRAQ